MASVFTIDDEDNEGDGGGVPSSDDETRECVSVETWINKPDVQGTFQCHEIKDNAYMYPW